MQRLAVICATSSPRRTGAPIAAWIADLADQRGRFEVDRIDLRELNLPFYDEPELPRTQRYVHEHTKVWSRRVAAADAFIVVSPEYNHSFPGIVKNAFDFLHVEWAVKPLGIISYGGGVSAGLRGAEALRVLGSTLQMYPLAEQVMIPFVASHLEAGVFTPTAEMAEGAASMLTALERIAPSMQAYRARTHDDATA